jgi:hypothetical protein
MASAFCDPLLRPHSKAAVTAGAAIVALAGGLMAFDVPESLAQGGLFEALFGGGGGGGGHQYVVEPLRYYPNGGHGWGGRHYSYRHSHRHYAHHFRHEREHERVAHRHGFSVVHHHSKPAVETADGSYEQSSSSTLGRRTVCVRACDGYFFPVANLKHNSDIASHQATCDSLCPQAETKLFVMAAGSENMDEAVSARGGELYSQFMARIKASGDGQKSCGCHSVAGDPVESKAVLNDNTLRAGDTVVTSEGVRVFRGGAFPHKSSDFMSLAETRDLPAEKRGALAAIDRLVKTPHGRTALLTERHHEEHSHKRHRRSDLGGALHFN